MERRIDRFIEDGGWWDHFLQLGHQVEQTRIDAIARECTPALKVTAPATVHILWILRRDKSCEYGIPWSIVGEFGHHGADPVHPWRVPCRILGKHVLHIDAQMHG